MRHLRVLGLVAGLSVSGCAVGAPTDAASGDPSKLEQARELANRFCDDALFTRSVGNRFIETTVAAPSDDSHSRVAVSWTPSEVGVWKIAVLRPDGIGMPPGITLARPLCDAAGNLADDAYAPLESLGLPTPTESSATFILRTTETERIWIDVPEPPGVLVVVRATRLGPVLPMGVPEVVVDGCSDAATCSDCTARATCGWCDGACMAGTLSPPAACSSWAWLSSECEAP